MFNIDILFQIEKIDFTVTHIAMFPLKFEIFDILSQSEKKINLNLHLFF